MKRSLALLLLLWIAGAAAPALAQNDASCTLSAGSNVEATLGPPGGEDEAFLGVQSKGGLPYIAFVIDTSAYMRGFPVDLTSPALRAAGLGCGNTVLDALTYQANPCVDGKDALVVTDTQFCSASTKQPVGYGAPYSSSRQYLAFDQEMAGLFAHDRYYVHDRGWGVKGTEVQSSWVKARPLDACTAAGVGSGEQSECVRCLDARGYYLPVSPRVPPVLKGNWMNFNPPKYVIARKLLKDEFARLDQPSRTRQAMLTTVDSASDRCFSRNRGGAGMDAAHDGASLIGNPTQFKPPCGQFAACVHNGSQGGGRAGFDNAVNHERPLFTSPTTCPSNVDLPSEAPPGAAAVSFSKTDVCRGSFVSSANTELAPAVCAPYAEALLNAGQYLSDDGLYDRLFTSTAGGTWRKSVFDAPDGVCGAASCGCPRPTVILLAGGAPGFDDNLPCEVTGRGCTPLFEEDACRANVPGARSNLARVARFLANANIKPNEHYNSPAHVRTYVIDFGSNHPDLEEAAVAGGGKRIPASSADGLRQALREAIAAASGTQYSFSSAAISAVQTRTNSGLLVPRFTVSKSGAWPGKLFQFKLANEDTCGCREPAAAGDRCDFNRDGKCGGVFFVDAQGDFIASDAQGVWRKAGLVNGQFLPGVREAVPVWEAAKELEAKAAVGGTASSRKVLTVVDSNDDGAFDHLDQVVSFEEGNAELLLPYLNVGTGNVCERIGSKLGACLSPLACATKIIQFVRGVDVFDEDCRAQTTHRPAKLGDIFHSAPVLVDPPARTSGLLCRLGLSNQCLVSLTQTPTPKQPETAYEDYVAAHQRRDKVVLVGANDGMLHAFRGGRWVAEDNPDTPSLNECPSTDNCTGYYDLGDGEELWAFIPPDLLPKLSQLLLAQPGEHPYFVDGTAMVRDVWADDDGDAKKDASEFHTVAVVGERRGGNHFFALDLTRPEGPETLPSPGFFRWLYPQPNTAAARLAANSYADFLPSAPPIGPVRVKVPEDAPKTGDYRGSPYAERWVVLLNGGYDPSLLRGRTVSMVDVWRGGDGSSATQSLWTFSPGGSAYPFAAPAAMVGFGPGTLNPNNDPNGYFFDTATIGDVGGQLWTLRFNDPDPSTWTGARAFVAGTDSACGRQPFFQMTANAVATRGGHLRTLVGTGDRYNLTDQAGGSCSATNLVGCLRRGCTLEQNVRRTVCGRTTTFQRAYGGANTATECGLTADSLSLDPDVGTACCDEHVLGEVENVLRCTNTDSTPVEIRWTPRVDCQRTAGSVCGSPESRFVCTTSGGHPADLCERFDRCSAPVAAPDNGFYALKLFDEAERPVFDSPEAGAAYDEAALRPEDLVQVDPYTPSATRAPVTASGWAVRYSAAQHVFPTAFTGSALNERTTSQAAIVGGCSLFTTSTPGASSGACKPQTLLATTTYQLDFLSGGACSGVDASIATTRLVHRESAEPPGGGQLSVDVTPDGRVNIKLASVSRSVGGAAVVTPVISSNELIKSSYRLPVTRADHACRHPEGATVGDQRASAQASCSVQ